MKTKEPAKKCETIDGILISVSRKSDSVRFNNCSSKIYAYSI